MNFAKKLIEEIEEDKKDIKREKTLKERGIPFETLKTMKVSEIKLLKKKLK